MENILSVPARKRAWKTESDADITPPPLQFLPPREPGLRLREDKNHNPLDLFKLFFSEDAMETLCLNSSKQAIRSIARDAKVQLGESWEFLNSTDSLDWYPTWACSRWVKSLDYWRRRNIFKVLTNLSVSNPSWTTSRMHFIILTGAFLWMNAWRTNQLSVASSCLCSQTPAVGRSVTQKEQHPPRSYDSVMSLTDSGYLGFGCVRGQFLYQPKAFQWLVCCQFRCLWNIQRIPEVLPAQ